MIDSAERDELNPFTWQSDIQAALAADAAAEWDAVQAREHAERARQAGLEAAALAEANAAADAAVAEVQEIEPPETIAILNNGMSTQRARLCRYFAWVEQMEAEHSNLVAGRAQHLASMGVPAATKASLDALIKADKTGLVAAMAQGKGLSEQQLRGHERAQLEAKLAKDSHLAEISRLAMDEVETAIDRKAAQIRALKDRRNEFIADALQEHLVATVGARILTEAEALRASILAAQGAAAELQRLRGVSHFPRAVAVQLPTPRLPGERFHSATEHTPGYGADLASGYELSFPVHLQQKEQDRWTAYAKALMADPSADITGA